MGWTLLFLVNLATAVLLGVVGKVLILGDPPRKGV